MQDLQDEFRQIAYYSHDLLPNMEKILWWFAGK